VENAITRIGIDRIPRKRSSLPADNREFILLNPVFVGFLSMRMDRAHFFSDAARPS
jgi:hypothetical protein